MNEMEMQACVIHSASFISFINAGSKYPRSISLSYESERKLQRNSSNFGSVMRDFVRGNSFFQK